MLQRDSKKKLPSDQHGYSMHIVPFIQRPDPQTAVFELIYLKSAIRIYIRMSTIVTMALNGAQMAINKMPPYINATIQSRTKTSQSNHWTQSQSLDQ